MKIRISTACIFFLYSTHSYALGDLLMSAQQRAQIDAMRSNKNTIVKQENIITQAMEINGFFFKNHDERENGTIWINGKQVTGSELQTGIRLKKINERDKTVSILFENTSTSTPLKAGQKLQLNNGEIQDAYEP